MAKLDLSDYRRFALEFALIVFGVLVALAVDDWRQARADRATEQYILQGILADLETDRGDIESSIRAANARAAGADKLLVEIGHAAAGNVQSPTWGTPLTGVLVRDTLDEAQALQLARQLFPLDSLSPSTALRMLLTTGSMQRINVSAATFTEASATGGLDLLRDVDLRGELAQYYYSASRFSGTTDERADDHWRHLRNVLASRGLAADGGSPDADIIQTVRRDSALVAELLNARDTALQQIILNSSVLADANELAQSIEEALEENYGVP